ncbi:ABC transporter ATP-binding protein [Paractinoplanes abujensis]|uniref:Putative ABC transport system ATP-binding protein n=1 Tax=Paractinoplanes abujensis TaxID=882441 RepID=A0A7W7G2Q8_9ACTN|nr:ATP-binding cassette domain-containing protein [Actinoplanes abujensis]MBB4695528.1 putative ABC transport system ATP-binding protein [Actinoplanes abujensis]GID23112.1 ABC transporter ATP-binding protein [Actinoplanes abujensis]
MTTDLLVGRELLQLYAARTGPTQALRGVDVSVVSGRVSAITGPSGSGKSTLLAVLALRERPAGGELRHRGRLVSSLSRRDLQRLRRREIGWVAQRPTHSLFPQLDARGQITQIAQLRRVKVDVDAALAEVSLTSRATAHPGIMSGGEQQRLAVAAAGVGPPSLLIADEPTAELDDESAALVLRLLRARAAAGSAVVIATHDARAIAASDTVLRLRHGVLSGEHSAGEDRTVAIDGLGRLQLPEEALPLFPDGRAVVTVVDDHVELRPPA